MKKSKMRSRARLAAPFFLIWAALSPRPAFSAPERTAAESYRLGAAQQAAEDWRGASRYFMDAVRSNPVYADAWFALAECSYQLGEQENALSYLDTAEKYMGKDSRILNLRGMISIARERFDEARSLFESVLRDYPNDIDARFGLAELELFDGRITGAEAQYQEALRRQGTNRKALLSLAVVSVQLGKHDAARRYIRQALDSYSGESEVHYLSAVVRAAEGDLDGAERSARIAVEIDGNDDKSYDLLARILYEKGAYEEAVDICDFRIGRDRNLGGAWYLKGCAQRAAGNSAQAIDTWSAGLSVAPQDEVMRAALELEVRRTLPVEDGRRADWAAWHVAAAREYGRRYDAPGASEEYRRALKVDPSNAEARAAFAEILRLNGFHELYFEQLKFLQDGAGGSAENTRNSADGGGQSGGRGAGASGRSGDGGADGRTAARVRLDDTVEAYDSLLQDTLAKKWGAEPFYLDKTRWHLGIYDAAASSPASLHAGIGRIAAEFAADSFSGIAVTAVSARASSVSDYGEAYQSARSSGEDYFILLTAEEGLRGIELSAVMYSGRTGTQAAQFSFYAAGNDRFSSVFRQFRSAVLEKLPVRGKILDRDGKDILVDIGKSERIADGAVFDVVRKGAVSTAGVGTGLVYKESDTLGTLRIDRTGEEISQGTLSHRGFYDRVRTGDEVVLVSLPETGEENAAAIPAPAADAGGNPAVRAEERPKIDAEEFGAVRRPPFIDLIRSIY